MSQKHQTQSTNLSKEIFRRKYSGKIREQFNKAIRQEIPGGHGVLNTMAFLHGVIHRVRRRGGQVEDPEKLLEHIMDLLSDGRNEMVRAIRKKYAMPPMGDIE